MTCEPCAPEPAAALRGVGPPVGQCGVAIREDRHVQYEQRKTGLADQPAHCPREECLTGIEAKLRSQQMHDARLLRGREQHPGFRLAACERFLAEHVPARINRFQHEG